VSFHLVLVGQCEAAFQFYERTLGGKIVHANFAMGVTVLARTDVVPEQYVKPQGFYVLLSVDDALDAERIFSALAENGEVHMAIQKTFWSSRFGRGYGSIRHTVGD
jgi:PhnB protein